MVIFPVSGSMRPMSLRKSLSLPPGFRHVDGFQAGFELLAPDLYQRVGCTAGGIATKTLTGLIHYHAELA